VNKAEEFMVPEIGQHTRYGVQEREQKGPESLFKETMTETFQIW
jgi:hypothetical protein